MSEIGGKKVWPGMVSPDVNMPRNTNIGVMAKQSCSAHGARDVVDKQNHFDY